MCAGRGPSGCFDGIDDIRRIDAASAPSSAGKNGFTTLADINGILDMDRPPARPPTMLQLQRPESFPVSNFNSSFSASLAIVAEPVSPHPPFQHNIANDDDCRRTAHFRASTIPPRSVRIVRSARPVFAAHTLQHGDGRVGGKPVGNQFLGYVVCGRDSHIDNKSAPFTRKS